MSHGVPSGIQLVRHAPSAHIRGSEHSSAGGSPQGVPNGVVPSSHEPVVGSQMLRHSSKQLGQLESPVHVPFSQWSLTVQRLLSLQVVPLGFAPEHVPVAGSHVPALRHCVAGQVIGLLPVHVPA